MTTRAPFTQAAIRRIIRAAKEEGAAVQIVMPDGTILVDGAKKVDAVPSGTEDKSEWEDVEA